MSRSINRPEWTEYVHDGRAFGWGGSFAALASNVNLVQLYNPVRSGVRVVVFQALIAAGASALQTQYMLDPTLIVGAPVTPVNLLAGSLNPSVATLQTLQQTAGTQALAIQIKRSITLANTKDDMLPPASICEIAEGQGFDIITGTANAISFASVWWAEIPTARYA